MPRIPYLSENEVHPRIKQYWEEAPMVLNINRVVAHAETVYKQCMGMGAKLMLTAELPPNLRELAILRVAHLSGAEYEWSHHRHIALGIGFSEEQIEAVKNREDWRSYSELERLVLEFTDEVARNYKASDELFFKLAEHLTHRQMVELILSIGYWGMIARLLLNAEVEMEKRV